jgi:hypothetical protein
MGKVLLGGLVGGIVVFIWGAVSHMATPIGEMGIRQIANEDKVVGAMKGSIHEPGFYFFPGMENMRNPSDAERTAWEAKIKQGPTGVLVIHPEGGETMSPKQLSTEFASNVVAALLAAIVLTQVRAGYFGRVLVVALMGIFGFVSICVSYWNWYGFPTDFTIGAALDESIGWILGGLALAAIVRPATIKKSEVTE